MKLSAQRNLVTIKRINSLSLSLTFFLLPLLNNAYAEHSIGHNHFSQTWGNVGDLLIFPDTTVISRFGQESSNHQADSEIIPELNVFYTADYQGFRFLGEWLLSTKSHNMERLQLGVHIGDSSLWLGRFHSPIGFWNMQYHHAAVLQTSISRPGVMMFETSGGVIPNHLTGLLLEGIHEAGLSGFYYSLGVGAGPELNTQLLPFNIFEPSGSHRPGVAFRVGYQPISYGIDEIGVSIAYTELPGDKIGIVEAQQFVATAYSNWQFNNVQLTGEIIYANNQLDINPSAHHADDFVNGYGQLAWTFHRDWTLYGRVEGTLGAKNNAYLNLFSNYVEDRVLGGIRYDLNRNMAFKIEATRDQLKGNEFGQFLFQWSAVFP